MQLLFYQSKTKSHLCVFIVFFFFFPVVQLKYGKIVNKNVFYKNPAADLELK